MYDSSSVKYPGASLVVQWLRIRLQCRGHGFEPWSGKIPHAADPTWSNQAHVPQLLSLRSRAHVPQLLSPHVTATEACTPRARALQQEKPPQ